MSTYLFQCAACNHLFSASEEQGRSRYFCGEGRCMAPKGASYPGNDRSRLPPIPAHTRSWRSQQGLWLKDTREREVTDTRYQEWLPTFFPIRDSFSRASVGGAEYRNWEQRYLNS